MLSKLLKVVLPIVVLAIGVSTLVILVKTKPQAQRAEQDEPGLLVEVAPAESGRHDVVVEARGSVIPAKKIALQPQVSGRVMWQSDELVPGGRFDESDLILRLDPSDYQLALESSRAQVSKAQLDLRLERGRRRIAEREWEKFGGARGSGDGDEEADEPALALREPHEQTAKVAVSSARSAVKRAQLDLRRTRIEAPFNALVIEENVDRGQVVGPQTPVATLVGTDHFWVRVSVPVDVLQSIAIPGVNAETGASARVIQTVAGRHVERPGRVVRLLGNLEEGGTMARLLVEIDDPLGLEEAEPGEPHLPMLIGSYVKVDIDARPLDGVFELPRAALREGNQVYLMDDEGRLAIRDVRIAWRREKTVLVSHGLRDGERVVTSRVPTPVEGTALQLPDDGDPPPVAKAPPTDDPREREERN